MAKLATRTSDGKLIKMNLNAKNAFLNDVPIMQREWKICVP
jgi:hypothetical protein